MKNNQSDIFRIVRPAPNRHLSKENLFIQLSISNTDTKITPKMSQLPLHGAKKSII